jgi:hypothetical protein
LFLIFLHFFLFFVSPPPFFSSERKRAHAMLSFSFLLCFIFFFPSSFLFLVILLTPTITIYDYSLSFLLRVSFFFPFFINFSRAEVSSLYEVPRHPISRQWPATVNRMVLLLSSAIQSPIPHSMSSRLVLSFLHLSLYARCSILLLLLWLLFFV